MREEEIRYAHSFIHSRTQHIVNSPHSPTFTLPHFTSYTYLTYLLTYLPSPYLLTAFILPSYHSDQPISTHPPSSALIVIINSPVTSSSFKISCCFFFFPLLCFPSLPFPLLSFPRKQNKQQLTAGERGKGRKGEREKGKKGKGGIE